ncbi:Na+/H+ antiporter NhaA, partial [Chitinophaga sp.]|uniref:Na+/H+ antiporter NhaA n=1 Tax=Chitinophaga sp. TaxID=1869181 RepID=UPI00262289D4
MKLFSIKDRLLSPIWQFLHDSRAVGIVLIVCTVVSMILANSAWGTGYTTFFSDLFDPQTGHHLEWNGLHLPNSWLLWINDGLMVLFFFL